MRASVIVTFRRHEVIIRPRSFKASGQISSCSELLSQSDETGPDWLPSIMLVMEQQQQRGIQIFS